MNRRNGFRLALILFLIAFGALLFYIGKEHQVFLDDKAITLDGKTYPAIENLKVSVNGGEALEFVADDRDVTVSDGPFLSVKVEITDADGKVLRTIERSARLRFQRSVMVSLPALAGGAPNFLIPPPAQE
jgi:hypothetical protein